MKQTVKRLLALMLSVMMILSLNGFTVFAESASDLKEEAIVGAEDESTTVDVVAEPEPDAPEESTAPAPAEEPKQEAPAAEPPAVEPSGEKEPAPAAPSADTGKPAEAVETASGDTTESIPIDQQVEEAEEEEEEETTSSVSEEGEEGEEEATSSVSEEIDAEPDSSEELASETESAESTEEPALQNYVITMTAVTGEDNTPISESYTNLPAPEFDEALDLSVSPFEGDVTASVLVEGTHGRYYLETYKYDYAIIGGEQVTELRLEDVQEDTEILLHYSVEYKKARYVYEDPDSRFKVTAEVVDPAAIPDDAIFSVKEITRTENETAYDAYFEALNNQAEEIAAQSGKETAANYNEGNTVLYDISFLEPKADEEGNIIENEFVEIKPDSNAVSIQFEFHDNQLTSNLGVEEPDAVTVIHLPVAEEVTAAADSTQDALNEISADVISATVVDQQSTDVVNVEEINFEADSFSTYAISYTVDFVYDEYEYSIAGESNILLSDLFSMLHIDADIARVMAVTFSNPELVKVEQLEADWMLTSLKPFSSEETLTVEMYSGAKYVIGVTDDQSFTVSFGEATGVEGNWYPLIFIGDNRYAFRNTPINWDGSDSFNVDRSYQAHEINSGEAGSPYNGENVTVKLINTDSPNLNYLADPKQTIKADGDLIGKKRITVSSTDDGGFTVELVTMPDLILKTQFFESDGKTQVEAPPSDYKLLIKLVSGERTFYALQTVNGNQTNNDSVVFYEYKLQNGNYILDNTPYYYFGEDEELSTQVVTGAASLSKELIEHKVNGAIFYNENTVDAAVQNSDLTKDVFSTSSAVTKEGDDYLLTTTFTRRKNDGVDHKIEVNFYEKKQNYPVAESVEKATALGLSTDPGAYYFVVRLYNEGKLVAYKVKAAENVAGANASGTFTTTIGKNETFTIVDDKGIDIPNSDHIKYDPTVYTSKVRLYQAKTANDLPTKLSDVGDKGIDNLPNYSFMYNKSWTDDPSLKSDTQTETKLGLYRSGDKIYQVEVVVEDGTKIAAGDKLDLHVEALHETTATDVYESTISGGESSYNYVIENKGTRYWTSGSNNNKITGNETFKLYLKQDGKVIPNSFPIQLQNGESGKLYKVVYDTDTVDDDGVFLEKNVSINDDGTTVITHRVKIEEVVYDPALTPEEVLGDAYEFGIVADTYKQTDHTETNFAVKHYIHGTNFDIEGTNGPYSDVPFYAGELRNGFIVGNNTNADLYLYAPQSELDKGITQQNTSQTNNTVFPVPTSLKEINEYVDGMIDSVRQTCETMIQKSTIKPETVADGAVIIDTRSFPDDITIYVDCSDIMGKLSKTNQVHIKKKDSQTIIMNIPDSGHVNIGKFTVFDDSHPSGVESDTVAKNRDDSHNLDVDQAIFQHVFFNMPNADSVHTDNASAMFLAPNASKFTQSNGAGWIVCGGTVDSTSEWHFYRHNRHFSSEIGSIQINKKLNSEAPDEAKKKTYKFLVREMIEGKYVYYYKNPNKPVAGQDYNPVISSSDPVVLEINGSGSIKLEKLAPNKVLEIVELEDGREISGYTLEVTNENTNATVAGGRTKFVNITNSYTVEEEGVGKLKLTKTIKGDVTAEEADGALKFAITVTEGEGDSAVTKYLTKDGSLTTDETYLRMRHI